MRTHWKITVLVLVAILSLSACQKGGIRTETMTRSIDSDVRWRKRRRM